MASEMEAVKGFIANWISIYSSTQAYLIIFIYFLSGILTKSILINSGDYNYHHTFHNERNYKLENEDGISLVGVFDLKLKLKQVIINPPLRLSIIVFFAIIYCTNDIVFKDYLSIEIAFYFIGLKTPQFIKSIRYSLADKPPLPEDNESYDMDTWHQQETAILTLSQDRLNRVELVKRLFDIITSNNITDTRGIAIIGPFGIGKSSIINMTLSEVQMTYHNFIQCRINSWGTYSSEDQIQKHLIERIIDSLGQVTSTTSLSGLPSKYISSLKGAQSLWLDILPLFDNHSSPSSQLTEIDDLLEKLNLKVIIILEDLDRNKDAEVMLNSIAPLIDRLNDNGNFRFILSVGETLNNPNIINRICRYKEYVSLDRSYALDSIKKALYSTLQKKRLTYIGHVSHFFSTNNSQGSIVSARDALVSYLNNPRELKVILRQVELDWVNSLHGYCDILDLFAITTLMHYEPNLITSLLNNTSHEVSFAKLVERNNKLEDNLINPKSSEAIVNYFFDTQNEYAKPQNRLQSCKYDFPKRLQLISSRSRINDKQRDSEQSYFRGLLELNSLCRISCSSNEMSTLADKIYTLTDELIYYKDYDRFIYDYKALYPINSLIPSLVLIKAFMINSNVIKNEKITSAYMIGKLKGLRTKNHFFAQEIISDIMNHYLDLSLRTLLLFYRSLEGTINPRYITKPDVNKLMSKFKEQGNSKENINMYLLNDTLEIIKIIISGKPGLKENCYDLFMGWLISDKSTFSNNLIHKINNYKTRDQFSTEYRLILNLKDAMPDLTKPNELNKENEATV